MVFMLSIQLIVYSGWLLIGIQKPQDVHHNENEVAFDKRRTLISDMALEAELIAVIISVCFMG